MSAVGAFIVGLALQVVLAASARAARRASRRMRILVQVIGISALVLVVATTMLTSALGAPQTVRTPFLAGALLGAGAGTLTIAREDWEKQPTVLLACGMFAAGAVFFLGWVTGRL